LTPPNHFRNPATSSGLRDILIFGLEVHGRDSFPGFSLSMGKWENNERRNAERESKEEQVSEISWIFSRGVAKDWLGD
jgi:hypothetical protein